MLELGQSMAKTKNWPREGSSMFFLGSNAIILVREELTLDPQLSTHPHQQKFFSAHVLEEE